MAAGTGWRKPLLRTGLERTHGGPGPCRCSAFWAPCLPYGSVYTTGPERKPVCQKPVKPEPKSTPCVLCGGLNDSAPPPPASVSYHWSQLASLFGGVTEPPSSLGKLAGLQATLHFLFSRLDRLASCSRGHATPAPLLGLQLCSWEPGHAL